MAELRVEAGEMLEVLLGRVDVTHLVGGFAEEVVRIADLPLLPGKLES